MLWGVQCEYSNNWDFFLVRRQTSEFYLFPLPDSFPTPPPFLLFLRGFFFFLLLEGEIIFRETNKQQGALIVPDGLNSEVTEGSGTFFFFLRFSLALLFPLSLSLLISLSLLSLSVPHPSSLVTLLRNVCLSLSLSVCLLACLSVSQPVYLLWVSSPSIPLVDSQQGVLQTFPWLPVWRGNEDIVGLVVMATSQSRSQAKQFLLITAELPQNTELNWNTEQVIKPFDDHVYSSSQSSRLKFIGFH